MKSGRRSKEQLKVKPSEGYMFGKEAEAYVGCSASTLRSRSDDAGGRANEKAGIYEYKVTDLKILRDRLYPDAKKKKQRTQKRAVKHVYKEQRTAAKVVSKSKKPKNHAPTEDRKRERLIWFAVGLQNKVINADEFADLLG